ncbi:hypothetical protein [Polynucleobacter sp. MWH-UH2A]|uniref:type IV pilus modification PilV family protein n=1 Tax=Polynucleobacter sp. MWH-UH2A TaxID=1855617 RepID=UPI001BFE0843|nr:hypothetical protein [Polynucleobacter sp. MWH-UH2A]QWD64317.1 hypothetical protein IC571_01415 [Polynucleobacter sp. MWH-UH2A]
MSLNTQNPVNGFILLEVLVAMSLILGVWMTSIGAYQGLALRFKQQESKHSHLRQTFDGYELAEQVRVNNANNKQISPPSSPNISIKDVKHESSRVSRRNHPLHPVAQPTTKNQH